LRTAFNIVVGIVVCGLVLMLSFGMLDAASSHGFAVRSTYTGVRVLRVDSGDGDVTVTGERGASAVVVVAHVTEGLFVPVREASLSGGLLRLHSYCHGYSPDCSVSYDVTVPNGTAVVASAGSGDVHAVDLNAGASLELTTGAGDISATGVQAQVIKLSSGAGGISAQLTAPAQRLSAGSGVGEIHLEVPGNVTYSVDATSGVGHVSDSQISTTPNAPRQIHASSGAGDVTITPVP
jgi:hypothetical protein